MRLRRAGPDQPPKSSIIGGPRFKPGVTGTRCKMEVSKLNKFNSLFKKLS